jgi:hypothetical protein
MSKRLAIAIIAFSISSFTFFAQAADPLYINNPDTPITFGGNQRIATGVTAPLQDFTVEVWFKDDRDNKQYERLADKSFNRCFWLGRDNAKPNTWGGGVQEGQDPYGIFVTLQDGEWHQIVSIRKGNMHYIYGDGGAVVASGPVSTTACDATPLAIGAWGDPNSTQQRLTGEIKRAEVLDRALTIEEIKKRYDDQLAKEQALQTPWVQSVIPPLFSLNDLSTFDGNQRIATGVTAPLQDFTVEVWFKDDRDNKQYERLADKSFNRCFWLGRDNAKPNTWGGGVQEGQDPYGIFVTLQDGEWHQIVSIRKGNMHYIYGDGGAVVASGPVSTTACDATPLAIGAWGDPNSTQQRLTGEIEGAAIFDRALTLEEVKKRYDDQSGAADAIPLQPDIDLLVTGSNCVDTWYYAKGPTEFYGPYTKCDSPPDEIDNDPEPWCTTQAAYVSGKQYGTDWVYCKDGGEAKCVTDPWLFVNTSGYPAGPHTGCANPDNDPNGTWCPTKIAYISKNSPIGQAGTTWDHCKLEIALTPIPTDTDTAWFSEYQYDAQVPSTEYPASTADQVNWMQSQIQQEMASTYGCWKSDTEQFLDPAKGQKPGEAALMTKGKILWTDPSSDGATVQSGEDFCKIDASTGKSLLQEHYCAIKEGTCLSIPKCANMPCALPSICIGEPAVFSTHCKTGTECKDGACVPATGSAAWDGCFVGQTPFLDSNGNGTPDACACLDGTFPKDTNGDGNSDTCNKICTVANQASLQTQPDDTCSNEFCGYSDDEKVKYGIVDKAKGLDDGGWTLSEYCSTPFEITSIVCSELDKSKGIKSTSKKSCGPGQICMKGNCTDTNGDLCDGTNSNKDAKIKGWVTVNNSMQYWDKCGDKCAAFKTDPAAYNSCLQNIGKYPDIVQNVLCSSPIDSSIVYYPTPCAALEYCDDGVCKPKKAPSGDGGGGGGGSGGNSTPPPPYDPNKPPTPPGGDNPPPDPGEESKTKTGEACTVKSICSELTDANHPIENGIMLMGEKPLFGVATTKTSCGGDPIGIPKPAPDICSWQDTNLLPLLTQFGSNGGATCMTSVSPCDWAKGEACNWKKTKDAFLELQAKSFLDWLACITLNGIDGCILEMSKPFAPGGVCQKNLPKPNVSQTPATATSPAKITGANAFGDAVNHEDVCVPAQGKKAIKKWKVVDSPEGAQAYFETCPEQHHCEEGICKPDPCLANKDKIDDKDPCTTDSCKEDTGDIFNTPVAVDDYDNCTDDKCANVDGKAVITHDAIGSESCKLSKLCTEKPLDPLCITPVLDCSKTPDNPACPQKPKDINCDDPANKNDPKCITVLDCVKTPDDPLCKPKVDCSKTPDNPACPKPAKGGFSCDDPVNKNDPQCKSTKDYCYDNDVGNDLFAKGTAVVFPGTPQEQSATDTCVEFDGLKFTAVLQVSCGPNNTFFLKKAICPSLTTNGCDNGICVPK